MGRQATALLLVATIVSAATFASAIGWLGNVSVCGADRTPGCITWPLPVSEALWVLFLLGILGLLLWQVRT